MLNTISSRTDNQILFKARGLQLPMYKHTSANFVVMLARNTMYFFAHEPKNQAQGRGFRPVKILY